MLSILACANQGNCWTYQLSANPLAICSGQCMSCGTGGGGGGPGDDGPDAGTIEPPEGGWF